MKLLVCCFEIKAKERVLLGLPGGTCSPKYYQPG